MSTKTNPPASRNTDNEAELLRTLMRVPVHRQWCVEVVVTVLGILSKIAPLAANFITPLVTRVIGKALVWLADAMFYLRYGTPAA